MLTKLEQNERYTPTAPEDKEKEFYDWFLTNHNLSDEEISEKRSDIHKKSIIRKLSIAELKELILIDMQHIDVEDRDFQRAYAIKRYMSGEQLDGTICIGDWITYGYGECCSNGFFEFPITDRDLKRAEIDIGWCLRRGKFSKGD